MAIKCKICGLFREQDIEFANEAKPDFIGFVFAEKSRRFVNAKKAEALRKNLAKNIVPVGVFVNAEIEFICNLYKDKIIEIAQLHGNEDDGYIKELKNKIDVKIIRSEPGFSGLKDFQDYLQMCDYLLLDSSVPGGGVAFDWGLLKGLDLSRNIFLAGGINFGNIDAALELNPFAVDVSSGVETDGVKDGEKIFRLVERCRR